MNALELLERDHEKISDLFDQLWESDDLEQKWDFFEMIKEQLIIHTEIEERIFYPTFADREGFEDIIESALDDHQEMKDLLGEVDSTEDENEMENRVDELQECVEQHIADEENLLFPKVHASFSEAELEDLGRRLNDAKKGIAEAA